MAGPGQAQPQEGVGRTGLTLQTALLGPGALPLAAEFFLGQEEVAIKKVEEKEKSS